MSLDSSISLTLNTLVGHSPIVDGIISFVSSYLFWMVGFLFLIFLYRTEKIERKRQLLFVALSAAVVARAGVGEVIRHFYHRPRPFLSLPDIHPLFTVHEWSFPSGHALFLFAFVATVHQFDKKWGIIFYIIAVLTSLGRVISGVHYISDIVAGAILGVGVAYAIKYVSDRYLVRLR